MLEEQDGTLNQLPEDVLASILRRLAPRFLATSRCVCKTWCTIIDTRRLLHADLLPLSLAGIFFNFHHLLLSEFFSRFSTGPTISNCLPPRNGFRRFSCHCNGLLLLDDYVVNPATCQWVQLPPSPSPHLGTSTKNIFHKEYPVFDPAVSPHNEVFLIPFACARSSLNHATDELEWPLSPCILFFFDNVPMHTSRTKKWEERLFVREGEAAGTVAGMRLDGLYGNHYHNAVYWRGALYVHCQTNFVMRISLLDGKYQVIKPPPVHTDLIPDPKLYLGKSQKGVYCALDGHYVYILNESYGKMEWVLKSTIGFRYRQTDRPKPWTLQDVNYGGSRDKYEDGNDEFIMKENFEFVCDNSNVVETKEWDSDDDNVIDTEGWDNRDFGRYVAFLGFHPYKEVAFLREGVRRGLASHLNTSKVQQLGNLSPLHYKTCGLLPFIVGSFPCTPWMGEFPEEDEF